jgi:hypothetical protein|tara:strand:+ start:902 stop:1027 length:126 start_codon:yes stop_codon:yes gene_type:complete
MQHVAANGGEPTRHFHRKMKIECAPFHDGMARFALLAQLMR